MSTVGKVLVVLVALATLPYLYLYVQVYQLHTNWGKEVQGLEKQIADVGQQAKDALAEAAAVRLEATQSQEARLRETTGLRNGVSKLEKLLSMTVEQQERTRLLLKTMQDSIALAETDKSQRANEIETFNAEIAKTNGLLEELKADVTRKLTDLGELRTQFTEVLAKNQEMVKRMNGSASRTGRTRPASFTRSR